MSRRARRSLWTLICLAILLVAGAVSAYFRGSHPALDPTRDYSSFRTNPWGTKALRQLCTASGLTVHVWQQPLAELPAGPGTLCIFAPSDPLSDADRDYLADWIAKGGRLLVAVRDAPAETVIREKRHLGAVHALLAWLGYGLRPAAMAGSGGLQVGQCPWTSYAVRSLSCPEPATLVPCADARAARAFLAGRGAGDEALEDLPEPLGTREVGRLALEPGIGAGPGAASAAETPGALGVALTLGSGRVDVLADVGILSNAQMGQDDNVLLAAAIVLAGAAGPVYFDEYHHGLAGEGRGPASRAVNAALWALAAALIIYVLAGMWRMARARAYRPRPRRTVGDHVRAVAWLYQRAGMGTAAADMLGRGVRRLWAVRLGVRPDATPAQFGSAAKGRGLAIAGRLERALTALDGALAHPDVARADLLKLGAELTALRRERMHRV
jgi:hypothetical protein